MLGVKELVGVEEGHKLPLPYILDAVRESWRDVEHDEISPAHPVLDHRATTDVAKADHRLPLQHQKLLALGVVVVVAAGDARSRTRHEDLSEARLLQHLGQGAPLVYRATEVVREVGPSRCER